MYRFILIITGMLVNTAAFSQDRQIIHLWDQVPGQTEAKAPHTLSENRSRSVTRIARVTDPLLHVYLPAKGKDRSAGIIVCPGGGYNILAFDLEGQEIAEWLSSLGYTAFLLEYRVPDKREQALQDIQRAFRVVRSRAGEWGIDPEQLGAIGFSAGGHLAASAASRYEQSLYPPQDAADSLSACPSFLLLIYPAYLDKGPELSLSPELSIGQEHPPTFLFGTADDSHGNSVLVMAKALRNAKAPVEQHLYSEGGHGYGLRPGNPAADAWPSLAEKWLNALP